MKKIILSCVLLFNFIYALPGFSDDSFEITRDGVTYLCERTGDSDDGNCWEKCPWTFDTCAESCGGGDVCWDKCPWTFDTCAESCGGGSTCWDKCPWTFDTCAETCGSQRNKGLGKDHFHIKFLLSNGMRLKDEIKFFGKPYSKLTSEEKIEFRNRK